MANIKIQGGGGGAYSNSGSSFGAVSYLKHEDAQRQEQGQEVEPFFNQDRNVSSKEVVKDIDSNKAKLCKDDAKFYVMTVSPSQQELKAMGKTPQKQSAAMKEWIRNDVMKNYAENFNKGLNEKDIKWHGKIHHGRGENTDHQMHCHILISRKDMSNTKKLSPQTNHKSAERSGKVKSGFDRTEFYRKCEQSFDKRFNHSRDYKNSFDYQNAMKNGNLQEKQEAIKKKVEYEKETLNKATTREQIQPKEKEQKKENSKTKKLSIGL
ncbi:DUF5712 family protein [Dysgonomonas sp. 25]|uniref:DUF5712 family protein n=1 Tax=Dysgonomonas sp. 25 TaxID=2302933 RepID=UPI0013D3F105|nr:DUF5712 family protein [Dysgonomonas sp. 25]NDV68931.1 clindamycin resistance transfer factor BtgB [Dysgonomonas sp. 25]